MCEAPTGTGKTLAYIIAAVQKIKPEKKTTQVVILSHTQILAVQILTQTRKITDKLGISATLCLSQDAGYTFAPNSHIVIATPGAFLANFTSKLNQRTNKVMAAKYSPSDVK